MGFAAASHAALARNTAGVELLQGATAAISMVPGAAHVVAMPNVAWCTRWAADAAVLVNDNAAAVYLTTTALTIYNG